MRDDKDPDEVLKDGQKLVVKMVAMDSAYHRPGVRSLTPQVRDASGLAAARIRAYDEYEHDLVNAWRGRDEYANPGWSGRSGELRGSKVGDPCTKNGWRGVLVRGEDGELVCRIKRPASGRDAVSDDCEGTVECPTCSGTGVARGTGWLTEPDEDIESFVEAATRGTTTHHESNVRRDVLDIKTVDRLRAKHAANMQKIYADSDRELSEQWRKK